MLLATYAKQPSERKDYDIDFAPFLGPIGDSIDDIAVEVVCLTDPEDMTLVCEETLQTLTTAKLWVSGGTSGNQYKMTVRMSTVAGRIDESELKFKVKDI